MTANRPIGRVQIERAERVALQLEAKRRRKQVEKTATVNAVLAGADAQKWERPASLRTRPVQKKREPEYEFTDAQLQIALRSLG
jgi:hypothetical protein